MDEKWSIRFPNKWYKTRAEFKFNRKACALKQSQQLVSELSYGLIVRRVPEHCHESQKRKRGGEKDLVRENGARD